VSIAPGTCFGPYEIAEAMGAGGMGEVYRATDTTLDRDVAIKARPRNERGVAVYTVDVTAP
jgi:serine/threonine protein kinase